MSAIKIEGKSPISGIVKLSGNKNAILPMIAAAMLCDEEITLCNVPDILDVRSMLEIFAALGGKFEFQNNILSLSAASANTAVIPRELCSKNRTSILYAAPLLVRFGKATVYPPGGDVIGRRRLDGHIYGLKTLGSTLNSEEAPAAASDVPSAQTTAAS